jgi:hypothetical protein
MNQSYPVPPPELVQQWWAEETYDPFGVAISRLATQAARWGADQELEACCGFIGCEHSVAWSSKLRDARRPKPPSLKEQALKALTAIEGDFNTVGDRADTIRRALEQLDD